MLHLPCALWAPRARFLRTLFIGLVLWGAALAALSYTFGWDGLLTRMGWFFTKAALLNYYMRAAEDARAGVRSKYRTSIRLAKLKMSCLTY